MSTANGSVRVWGGGSLVQPQGRLRGDGSHVCTGELTGTSPPHFLSLGGEAPICHLVIIN